MRFDLEGLDVFFPYDYLYKEQYEYMLHLKRAIDDKGHVLLEMPTGTGKTVCLISLITSYQYQYPQTGKLIYCTRTVPEMSKCMEEIKRVIEYRTKMIGPDGGKVLALCLSSRRNMCIHPNVLEEGDRDTVDSLCRNMTASWVRSKVLGRDANGAVNANVNINLETGPSTGAGGFELCNFYENYSRDGSNAEVPQGVYSLDDLKELGAERGWCPYFMTRHLIHHSTILVYNYQYMLDPKVSNLVSRELEAESIVVFDEAHNIDNVCIEALSVTLDRRMLEASTRSVNKLQSRVAEMKASDSAKLAKEYAELVRGLAQQRVGGGGSNGGNNDSSNSSSSSSSNGNNNTNTTGGFLQTDDAPINTSSSSNNNNNNNNSGNSARQQIQSAADSVLANPLLTSDILEEAVPGNIRKAEHFVSFLKKIVQYFKTLMLGKDVVNKTPLAFLHDMYHATALERKPLRFTYTRLNSLLRTLEITSLDDFNALQDVANFATLVSTYMDGFAIITEPAGSVITGVTEPLLQLCCLDASIAIKPVLERFQSVCITSGTLSPIDLYPKLLNFQPVQRASLPMSTFRPCLLPLIVTRGSDQIPISTRFELRKDLAVIRNYGQLLIDVAQSTPDGICCFFTSYQFMEYVVGEWDRMRILQQVLEHKLIYLETKDVVETTLALDNYKRACDSGRGAVFLSVARGKVAEGIDFDRHYGRCVILFGIPYQYTLSHVLRARLNYMRERYNIRDNDFLTFDALRQAAQCVGRVIRSKTDYGIVILADSRYNRQDKRSKFPPWVLQFVKESSLNLPTDGAIDQIKTFLRYMGQPIDQESLHSILLNESQVSSMFSVHKAQGSVLGMGQLGNTMPGATEEGMNKIFDSNNVVDLVEDNNTIEVAEMNPDVVEQAIHNSNINSNINVVDGVNSVDSAPSSVDVNGEEYMMDIVTSIATHDTATTTTTNTDVTNPTTATVRASNHGNSVNRHSKSLFLFEDILDASDTE